MFVKEGENQYNKNKETIPVPTELSKTLSRTEKLSQYDWACKKLLSNRSILAVILQKVVVEFEGYSLKEIEACIEPDIKVAPNPSSDPGNIYGMSNEYKTKDGMIIFDILFSVYLPNKDEKIKMIINIEAQKDFYVRYCMETRSITYGGVLLAEQVDTEIKGSNYDALKKVYSIFICMNASKREGNGIAEYYIAKRDHTGHIPDRPWAYDKMSCFLINLDPKSETDDEFLDTMSKLFSQKNSAEEKKQMLEDRYDIPKDRLEEVDEMCNMSLYVLEEGKEIERKNSEERENNVIRNMLKRGMNDELILSIAECTKERLEEVKVTL